MAMLPRGRPTGTTLRSKPRLLFDFFPVKKLFFLFALCGLTAFAKAQDVTFVVHPEFAETGLTADDIKQVLLGNLTKWRRGPAVKLVVLTEGPVHTKVI